MSRKLRRRAATAGSLLVVLAVVTPTRVDAQGRDTAPSPVPLAMAASAGSFAGLAAGAMLGVQTGWGGYDEDSFVGAVVLASAGSILGTTLAMKLTAHDQVVGARALGASVVGFGAGLAVTYAMAGATGDGAGPPIVFSVSQGVVAALLASVWGGR